MDEILKYNHSNESYRAVLSCGAVYYALQDDFAVCGSTFESEDEFLRCDYSNKSASAKLSRVLPVFLHTL